MVGVQIYKKIMCLLKISRYIQSLLITNYFILSAWENFWRLKEFPKRHSGAKAWRLRSDRNCWFCSFCRFCCARVGGQKLQKQLILGSWRYRSYWSSLSGICDFCSSRVGGQNPQNPLKKKRVPRWVHFWSYQIFQQFLCNLLPYPGTAESTEST